MINPFFNDFLPQFIAELGLIVITGLWRKFQYFFFPFFLLIIIADAIPDDLKNEWDQISSLFYIIKTASDFNHCILNNFFMIFGVNSFLGNNRKLLAYL